MPNPQRMNEAVLRVLQMLDSLGADVGERTGRASGEITNPTKMREAGNTAEPVGRSTVNPGASNTLPQYQQEFIHGSAVGNQLEKVIGPSSPVIANESDYLKTLNTNRDADVPRELDHSSSSTNSLGTYGTEIDPTYVSKYHDVDSSTLANLAKSDGGQLPELEQPFSYRKKLLGQDTTLGPRDAITEYIMQNPDQIRAGNATLNQAQISNLLRMAGQGEDVSNKFTRESGPINLKMMSEQFPELGKQYQDFLRSNPDVAKRIGQKGLDRDWETY